MADSSLHTLLNGSEGSTFRFTFLDGADLLAKVISATHVDLDDTIVLLRVGASPGECGWQVHLADVRSVTAPGGDCLFDRPSQGT